MSTARQEYLRTTPWSLRRTGPHTAVQDGPLDPKLRAGGKVYLYNEVIGRVTKVKHRMGHGVKSRSVATIRLNERGQELLPKYEGKP